MNDIGGVRLADGKYAIVDAELLPTLIQSKWHLANGYAKRSFIDTASNKRCKSYMHREINGTPLGLRTDHINGFRLDNRKSNLRTVTPTQSAMNYGKKSNTSSVYKGVSWNKQIEKWSATITANGKTRLLGYFTDEQKAAKTYNEAAINLFGQYARLNQL